MNDRSQPWRWAIASGLVCSTVVVAGFLLTDRWRHPDNGGQQLKANAAAEPLKQQPKKSPNMAPAPQSGAPDKPDTHTWSDFVRGFPMPTQSRKGSTFRYQFLPKQNVDLRIELVDPPAGASFSNHIVYWKIPPDLEGDEATLMVRLISADGRSTDAPIRFKFPSATVQQPKGKPPAPETPPVPVATRATDLPGPASTAVLAGAGKYLVITVPDAHQIAVYDVASGAVLKYLPMEHEPTLVAAGRDMIVSLGATSRVIRRWKIPDWTELPVTLLQEKGEPKAMAMGCDALGPLAIRMKGAMPFVLLDPLNIEAPPYKVQGSRLSSATGNEPIRASADGKTFVVWFRGARNSAEQAIVTVQGTSATSLINRQLNGQAVPNPDGSILAYGGGFVKTNGERISLLSSARAGDQIIPAPQGPLALRYQAALPRVRSNSAEVLFCLTGVTIASLPHSTFLAPLASIPGDQIHERLFFLPHLNKIVAIPSLGNSVQAMDFDLMQFIKDSKKDLLVVTSQPSVPRAGETWRYPIQALTNSAGLSFRLDAGPTGMTVSEDGVVNWKVPPDQANIPKSVVILVKDQGGQSIFHSFVLKPQFPTAPEVADGSKTEVVADPPGTFRFTANISDVIVGGGGQWVAFLLPTDRKVMILDVLSGKIVKELPLPDDQTRMAGCQSYLFLLSSDGSLHRYRADTWERDARKHIPFELAADMPGRAFVAGSASAGPLLIENTFYDIHSLQPIIVRNEKGERPMFSPAIRVSANGQLFAWWDPNSHNTGINTLLLDGRNCRLSRNGESAGALIPTYDGRAVYSTHGEIFDGLGLQVFGSPRRNGGGRKTTANGAKSPALIPAVDGSFYLSIARDSAGKTPTPVQLSFPGAGPALATPLSITGLEKSFNFDGKEPLTPDKRFILIQKANQVVYVPPTNDRFVLYPCAAEKSLVEAADAKFIYINAQPKVDVKPGDDWQCPVVAHSRRQPVTIRLDAAPPGMILQDDGRLIWKVPADADYGPVSVSLTATDPNGVLAFRRFQLKVRPKPDDPDEVAAILGPASVPLPGTVTDIISAGAGRRLLLLCDMDRKLLIIDPTTNKIERTLPLAEQGARVAASRDHIFVLYPNSQLIQRWKSGAKEPEMTARISPEFGQAEAICAAANAEQLILVACRSKDASKNHHVFFDPQTLAPAKMQWQMPNGEQPATVPLPGFAHAAANGGYITIYHRSRPDGLAIVRLRGSRAFVSKMDAGGIAVPDHDARYLYSAGAIYDAMYRRVSATTPDRVFKKLPILVPSDDPGFYLRIDTRAEPPQYQAKPIPLDVGNVAVAFTGNDIPIGSIADVDSPGYDHYESTPPANSAAKRVHFFASAGKLVVLGGANDRLHIYPFDIERALQRQKTDYLFVTSQSPRQVKPGEAIRVPIVARTNSGPVTYRLDVAPPGLEISPTGEMTWTMPADFKEFDVLVVVAVRNQAGQERMHRIHFINGSDAALPPGFVVPPNVPPGQRNDAK